ncbi:MAG: NAD-dependent epimerase/dehydratase family protein [Sphingobacteriia bacterium]|nr:NAD-dependent epimerase/dehydratase family protein [Sphingobacteriia bacterium]NCC39602.1 NAD-dependent epimerase/dehydratase family protein [Gammaproteobacteria bacterium]
MALDATCRLGQVLVTGATGKVGRRLVAALLEGGHPVTLLTRAPEVARTLWPAHAPAIRAADLTRPERLSGACEGIDTVFHLASHAPGADEPDLYAAPGHWSVTAEGTANLMVEAALSGVSRVIYLSSIKAMGEQVGTLGRPADESLTPRPETLYGRAKLAAEARVLAFGRSGTCHAAVLRLPMVYGLTRGGNLARLVAAVAAGRFPPWPRIENRRSAVHVEDAIAAAMLVACHPECSGEVYLVTDGRHYSTRWIYEQTRLALGRPIPSWTVPLALLRLAAELGTGAERLTGRRMPLTREGLGKLNGDAWFSSAKLEQQLGFRARHRMESEIRRLVQTPG